MFDEECEPDQTSSVVVFTTQIKEIFNSELSNANFFPNDNRNISYEYELSDDALAEAYKIVYLKGIEESQVIENTKKIIETLIQTKPYSFSLLMI